MREKEGGVCDQRASRINSWTPLTLTKILFMGLGTIVKLLELIKDYKRVLLSFFEVHWLIIEELYHKWLHLQDFVASFHLELFEKRTYDVQMSKQKSQNKCFLIVKQFASTMKLDILHGLSFHKILSLLEQTYHTKCTTNNPCGIKICRLFTNKILSFINITNNSLNKFNFQNPQCSIHKQKQTPIYSWTYQRQKYTLKIKNMQEKKFSHSGTSRNVLWISAEKLDVSRASGSSKFSTITYLKMSACLDLFHQKIETTNCDSKKNFFLVISKLLWCTKRNFWTDKNVRTYQELF